jgi:uncharacterized DUF497 family protein
LLIDFDPVKSARNEHERGLPFDRVEMFDWPHAIVWEDTRKLYPEMRMPGLGFIGDRLHVVCFTPAEYGIRVISLRKANKKERKRYEEETAHR